jgi:preprotein translocase subunit SecD
VREVSYFRIALTIFVTFVAFLFAAPNFTKINSSFLPNKSVNLGLDLRGGSHLLLDVDLDHYIKDQYEMLSDNLRKELRSIKIGYRNLRFGNNYVNIELRDKDDFEALKTAIRRIDRSVWVEKLDAGKISLKFNNDRVSEMIDNVIDQSIEIIRMRIDDTGTKEPIIQKQGDKQILLQVPGADNPQELKNMLGKTAKLTFHMVNDEANIEEALNGRVPSDSLLLYGDNGRGGNYPIVVKKKAFLSGDLLSDAKASFNQNTQPAVSISFNNMGGKIFGDMTKI